MIAEAWRGLVCEGRGVSAMELVGLARGRQRTKEARYGLYQIGEV